jgi:hypothetical protein
MGLIPAGLIKGVDAEVSEPVSAVVEPAGAVVPVPVSPVAEPAGVVVSVSPVVPVGVLVPVPVSSSPTVSTTGAPSTLTPVWKYGLKAITPTNKIAAILFHKDFRWSTIFFFTMTSLSPIGRRYNYLNDIQK